LGKKTSFHLFSKKYCGKLLPGSRRAGIPRVLQIAIKHISLENESDTFSSETPRGVIGVL
jgi:hypothetical protein